MSTFVLWRLFHRPGLRGSAGHTSMLAIIAFAAATTIFLTVLGGVHGFIWRASADHTVACAFDFGACRPDTVAAWKRQISDPTSLAQFSTAYVALAVFACMLLVVPFVALAGSAARLPHPAATPVSPPCVWPARPPVRWCVSPRLTPPDRR